MWLIVSSMVAIQEGNCQYCPSYNGLYPSVANCKCFFKCVDGVPIQKWCPPGQKFDVMSMTCTFPSKTVCAGSLLHMLPAILQKYQKPGGDNIQQIPKQQQDGSSNGHFHITLALKKPNDYGANLMQMMQMLMMMMQNQQQGMTDMGNMNMNNLMNKYQNIKNQQNMMMNNNMMMNQNMNGQNMMMNNNMMMNQNMNQQNMMDNSMMMNNQNMMNQNMNNQNMMNQNMMNQNMNQDMMNQNMMNQNMNQDMMNQNMNQNMMNQNMNGKYPNMMNQTMITQGGGKTPQCYGGCHKQKKQFSIVYELNLNKFPLRFKLFG